jgi:hypothetical protein
VNVQQYGHASRRKENRRDGLWSRSVISGLLSYRGTLAFDYEHAGTVELARKIDNLPATYIFKELQDHGGLPA